MQEYTFTDGSTHDYHEFNHKRFGNCLHVDTTNNQVSSANCDIDKQYICQSLQYIGKNFITSILFSHVTFTKLTNNGYKGSGACFTFRGLCLPRILVHHCYHLTEVSLKCRVRNLLS